MRLRVNYIEKVRRIDKMNRDMKDESLKPSGADIFEQLKNAMTFSELDSLRIDAVKYMMTLPDNTSREAVQKAIIKAKNRIKRG